MLLRVIAFIVCFAFLSPVIALAQDPEAPFESESKGLGFLLGQDMSLDYIENTFPDLKASVAVARANFASHFGRAQQVIIGDFISMFGQQKADDLVAQMKDKIRDVAIPADLTSEQAEAFLGEVMERANGNIDQQFLRPILAAQYKGRPAQEFSDGFKTRFTSKNHPKAGTLDFTLDIPSSWRWKEGDRPHIVQNFIASGRPGAASELITVINLADNPDFAALPPDTKLDLTKDDVAGMLPEGATLVDLQMTTLENRPAGLMTFDFTQDRLGVKLYTRSVMIVALSDHYLVMLSGMVWGADEENRNRNWDTYKPVFFMIGNSFVDRHAYQ